MTKNKITCTWCGLFSRLGAVCEICGSPLPAADAPRKSAPRARASASTDTARALTVCSWCGRTSDPGAVCTHCGSPLGTGHFLPGPPVRAQSRKALAWSARPAATAEPRTPEPVVEPVAPEPVEPERVAPERVEPEPEAQLPSVPAWVPPQMPGWMPGAMPHAPIWKPPVDPRWMPRAAAGAPEVRPPSLPGWMPLGRDPLPLTEHRHSDEQPQPPEVVAEPPEGRAEPQEFEGRRGQPPSPRHSRTTTPSRRKSRASSARRRRAAPSLESSRAQVEIDSGVVVASAPAPTYSCSRCHQPSDRPVCDACAEAFDLLRALSALD